MSGKHILAFEADPLYANMLSESLGAQGFEVEIVSDGVEGLDKATQSSPDLIYLCVELPKISGFSICNKLKKSAEAKDIPLIITSSEATEETFEKHKRLKVSADKYMHKPFDAIEIAEAVTSLLGGQGGGEAIAIDEDAEIMSAEELEEIGDFEEIQEIQEIGEETPDETSASGEDVETTEVNEPTAVEAEEMPPASEKKPSQAKRKPRTSIPPSPNGENIEQEWAELIAENRALSKENDTFRRKVESIEKELISMKASKKGGVSSSEFLDLREALNKKDREVLDLRDELHNKEKELLDQREKVNGLERKRADLEDKNIDLSKQLNELEGKLGVMTVERDTLAATCDEHANTIAEQTDQIAGLEVALEEEKNGRAAEVSELKRTSEETLRNREDALKSEAERQHEADEKAKEEALSAQKNTLTEEKEQAVQALRDEHAATVKAMEEAHAATVADLEGKIRNEEDKVKTLEEQKSELEASLDDTRGELESTKNTLKETEENLASTERTLGATQANLAKTEARLADAEARGREKDQTIAELQEQVELLSKDLDELNELATNNEEMVEKAKKAIAIAAQLLDELESVGDDDDEEGEGEEEGEEEEGDE